MWPGHTEATPRHCPLRSGRGFCRRSGHGGLWRWSRLRAYFLLRVAQLLDLVQPLLFFVDTHGKEFDHRLGHAQAALEFVDRGASALHYHENVNAVMKTTYGIGKTSLAHLVHALHSSA